MNYGCLDIKGYVASVNQAEPFEIYCLRGILHLIGRKKGRNFRELTLASVPAVLPFVPRRSAEQCSNASSVANFYYFVFFLDQFFMCR